MTARVMVNRIWQWQKLRHASALAPAEASFFSTSLLSTNEFLYFELERSAISVQRSAGLERSVFSNQPVSAAAAAER